MENFHKRIFAQVQVPGILVERNEFWVADLANPVFSVDGMATHALSLWKTSSARTRMWSRLGKYGEYLPDGHLGYVPANLASDVHVSGEGPAQNIVCYFDPGHFEACTGLGENWSPVHLNACRKIGNAAMTHIMWRLYDELSAPGFGSSVVVECLGRLLIIEIARYFKALSGTRGSDSAAHRLAGWQMNRIREYVEATHDARVTVQALAELCGVSSGYLHRVFKTSTGQTLGKYMEQIRVTKAEALLLEGRLTLKQIADRLGFCDANSFSVAFRRATGQPPKTYQRRMRE